MTTTRGGWTALLAVALAGAAACSGPAAPDGSADALRRDLDAATQASVAAPRTQFVSALELGRAAEPESKADAAPSPPSRRAAPRAARTVVRPVVRQVARRAAPAPAARVAAAPAIEAPAPEPRAEVAEAPRPAPPVDEPVVAAPSRRPAADQEPGRRRGGWTTADVIRNAPFPINP